jgi:hypothetical protein
MPEAAVAAGSPSLRELKPLRGHGVEWAEPGRLIVSLRERLLVGESTAGPFRPLGRAAAPAWRRAASRIRPVQRLLRHMVYNVVPIAGDSCFVTFDRSVGVLGPEGFRPLDGWTAATRVLRGACAVGRDGAIYFGAYLRNVERQPVHVYRYVPGAAAVEVVHTFAAGTVRHVHGVYTDPFDGSLWITTGDLEHECRILRTADAFATLDEVGGGDETWRCVSLQFAELGVVYAMDAEFRQNYLYHIERGTGTRRTLQAVEGPVYYSAPGGGSMFFGVAAELCPSQTGRFAALWKVDGNAHCTRIATFEKDRLPIAFLAGTLDFPAGPGLQHELLFRCTGVVPDNAVMALRL